MYVPSHFRMSDEEVQAFLLHAGAGDLVTYSPDVGLTATFLPFVHEPVSGSLGVLHGHVARNNDHWRQQVAGEALVVLHGPDGYVTPSWYASKREHGRVVPTWNYVTLHVYGELVVRDDVDYARWVVEQLTAKHEARQEKPWSVADAPADHIAGQLRAVVGLQVQVRRIEAKAKLSQNRPAADVDGVVTGLRAQGDVRLAEDVEAHRPVR